MVEKDVVQHIPEEDNDYYSDDDLFKISSWGADLSFRELIDRYDDNELIKPELQRKYVWDKTEASRFIDSILLGLPVPSIFLAKTKQEKMLIIDGYQRIMTVYDYVQRGLFSSDGKIFKLSRSEKINKRWRGKAFKELSETEQRKIKNTTIHAIIFVQQHPSEDDTSMYQVFERINTSGRTLMPQEIRNCVYQGDFNKLLIELNKNTKWRGLYGLEFEDERMRDIEYVLRFFALSSKEFGKIDTERISLKKFLNQFMGLSRSNNEGIIAKRKSRFNKCIDFIEKNFGKSAFHNISPSNPDRLVNKFNPTIYDSIMIATDIALKKNENMTVSGAEQKRKELLKNENYQSVISVETMKTENIKHRINLVLEKLYGISHE